MKLKPLLMLLLMLPGYILKAQSVPDADKKPEKQNEAENTPAFKFDVDFISNNVYMGRTNTTTVPIISPTLKYTFNPGIYISGSLNVLPNSRNKKLDGGELSAGYDFDLTDDLSGSVFYSKLFYRTTSNIVGSSISSVFSGGLDYDIGSVVTASGNFDYNINAKGITTDKVMMVSISHDFKIKALFAEEDFLLISPQAAVNFGTQNFYSGYVSKKSFKGIKRTDAQNALVQQYQQTLDRFTLLDYELSTPIVYKTGNFLFSFIPTLSIVQNQFKSAAIAKDLDLSKQSAVFYFTAGAAIKF